MNETLQKFIAKPEYYKIEKLKGMLAEIFDNQEIINTYKKVSYFNMPVSFDIETTSFISDYSEKAAIMYVWTLGINGYCFIGRTWEEFINALDDISNYLSLSSEKRLIIYVHNLAYEFQFIRKRLDWYKVFSIDVRKPIYAITTNGIEFRCSYMLSGYSLERLGNNLLIYKIKKLTGFLDYSLIRHTKTKLTEKELMYCVNDVLVVMAYIQERIETDGDITLIPLTKTGYVRKYCKQQCLGKGKKKNKHYKVMMKNLTLEPVEYRQLKRAFQGGFTHANAFYSGKVLDNVASYDFTSSYPTVMIAEKFPMSKGELIQITSNEEFERNINLYCCLFDVEIIGLEANLYFENYISYSRCWGVTNAVINNGRIVKADRLYTTITEQDFIIIRLFYKWEDFRVGNFRRYKKAYLPTEFVLSIIKLYQDKTKLKGVEGCEIEYMKSKEMLNSCYGMAVTDICRDEIIYSKDWGTEKANIDSAIDKYNRSFSRFLFYPWGVWVTAYARKNLFTGIYECGNDYVYSDTDSLKILNYESHLEYVEGYNKMIINKLQLAMMWHGLDPDLIAAETNKGVIKPLGVWDFEGMYTKFKTLGAKRYLTESNGELSLTVAGLSKSNGVQYLQENFDNPFNGFTDELYIPSQYTGKNIHTYLDNFQSGKLKDYRGVVSDYSELSSVHLAPAEYSLSIGYEYARYLLAIQTKEI